MPYKILALSTAAALLVASSQVALADSNGAIAGGVGGAVAGAAVAGPVGLVVGGVGGYVVGNSITNHHRYYRHAYVHHQRHYYQ